MLQHRNTFLILLLGCISYATCTEVDSCVGQPSPIFVSVGGCDKQPCILYNGGSADMNVTFEVSANSYTLAPGVRASLGGATITWPVPPDLRDGCKFLLNGYCPLAKGEVLIYLFSLPLSFPAIPVTLEFSLLGDNGVVFQCFRVAVIVRNP